MDPGTASRLIAALAVVLVALLAYYFAARSFDRFTLSRARPVLSRLDGAAYRVHAAHGDAAAAADTMAALNERVTALLRHLRAKYLRSPAGRRAPARAAATRRLLSHYNPDNLAENSPRDPDGDTSYTVNKGAILALCLREKTRGRAGGLTAANLHDLETLTFVTFHELTHIAITELNHPPKFWRTFKFVLEDAAEAGILRGVDYARAPAVYCGMDIDYNPLFDRSLPEVV